MRQGTRVGLPSNEPKRRTTRQRKKKGGNGDRDNDDEAEEGEDRAGATAAAAAAAVTAGQSSVQTSSGFGGVGTIGWSAPEVIALRSATEASFGGGRGGSVSSNKDDGVAAKQGETTPLSTPVEAAVSGGVGNEGTNSGGASSGSGGGGSGAGDARAADMFAVGCVFFYVLSGGEHIFGKHWYDRERNIVKGRRVGLRLLRYAPDALDAVQRLTAAKGEDRPTAAALTGGSSLSLSSSSSSSSSSSLSSSSSQSSSSALAAAATTNAKAERAPGGHPLFWSHEKRLSFLVELSDRLERESDAASSPILAAIERQHHQHRHHHHRTSGSGGDGSAGSSESEDSSRWVFGGAGSTWAERLDLALKEQEFGGGSGSNAPGGSTGKASSKRRRHYDAASVRDCLRFIRNKRHHWHELPPSLQELILTTTTTITATPTTAAAATATHNSGAGAGGSGNREAGSHNLDLLDLPPFPGGLGRYVDDRFPWLVLHCHGVASAQLYGEPAFAATYLTAGNAWASANATATAAMAMAIKHSHNHNRRRRSMTYGGGWRRRRRRRRRRSLVSSPRR